MFFVIGCLVTYKMFPHEIQALKTQNFVVRDHAFGVEISQFASSWVRDQRHRLRRATISKDLVNDDIARGDEIAWLTTEFLEQDESRSESSNALFSSLKKWRNLIETDLEFKSSKVSLQLARYEGNGTRYVRHSDVSKYHGVENSEENEMLERRVYTLVYYLNPAWKTEYGGGLRLYFTVDGQQNTFTVDPIADRLIIFPSSIEHEVLPTIGPPRWAVTLWLYSGYVSEQKQTIPRSILQQNENILVSIACYRDDDVANTVNNLFSKATRPDNITVGICWQGDETPPFHRIERPQQVRWCLLKSSEAAGPLFARNIILDRLFCNERYLLQIDAHSRLALSWDSKLIRDLNIATSAKPIITAYPAGFHVDPNTGSSQIDPRVECNASPILCADRFDDNGMLRIIGREPVNISAVPTPSYFWAAGFSFSESSAFFLPKRPQIPYLFFGEETLMAVYLWRYGWDFFVPSGENVIFHLWNSRTVHPETALVISGENRLRANHEYKRILKEWKDEREQVVYQRSFQEYQEHIGVDFDRYTISEKAKHGGRSPWDDFKIKAALPKRAMSLIDSFLS